MKLAIIEKLRAILDGGVNTECKVVYVLAETRKLLETFPPDHFPFALKLYCHWALHVDLDSRGTTLPFLENVEKYAASVLAGSIDIGEEHKVLREFVVLDTFRRQFRQFLQSFNLPTSVCDEDRRWHKFVKHYAGVIEDGSLSCNAKIHPLKLVSEVIFSKGKTETEDRYLPFGLEWTIVLLDGRRLTVDVNAALLHGIETIFSSTKLHSGRERLRKYPRES